MITCPWCGTSYKLFQSNCTNCGGPIPEPAMVEIQQAPAGEIPMPPPPPRPITDSYAWKLLLSDGWSITSMIFGFIGLIFGFVGLIMTVFIITAFVGIPFALLGLIFLFGGGGVLFWRYRETQKVVNVLRVGEAARGQMVDVQENYNVEVNGRHPWQLSYEFELNGGLYSGKLTTFNRPGANLQPGAAVCVLYLPGDPTVNSIYPRP